MTEVVASKKGLARKGGKKNRKYGRNKPGVTVRRGDLQFIVERYQPEFDKLVVRLHRLGYGEVRIETGLQQE